MTHRNRIFQLWLATLVTTASAWDIKSLFAGRQLEEEELEPIWGYQQGSANAHTDAGAMVYDYKHDSVVLVGTTHDNQFFVDDGAIGVDCFIATIRLPDTADEVSAKEAAASSPELAAAAAQQRVHWVLSGKHRVATPNVLDRCDLVASLYGEIESSATSHDHTFVGGTLAVNQNHKRDPIAVQPLLYETTIKNFMTEGVNSKTEVETGEPLQLFEAPPFGNVNGEPIGIPKKNDIIIPAMMVGHKHDLYIASVHRILVLHPDEIGKPNAAPKLQISLGIAKFTATDDTTEPLKKEWSHIEPTTILEVKADDVPHVTSGLFHGNPGMTPQEAHEFELEEHEIENEINEIEEEQEAYEEEQMQLDVYRHEYKNDGVLISGLEMVETSATESYLLIAGSAPGTQKGQQGKNSNHSMAENHPFMPHAPGYTSNIGDWDGFVAKLDPRTGALSQANIGINTWGYRLHTQPKRNDFIQSICVPRLPDGVMLPSNNPFHPNVVYAVGTTTGKYTGDEYGGAFVAQLDLSSMDVLWKQQIPGMNVHGMACQVLVDVASHGDTLRSESKDLIYVAGEVHGQMKVPMADGKTYLTHGHGETDVWVAQLRASDGKVNWVQQVGTSQQDRLAKNVNNPSVSIGQQESDIGDTGSGKGALVLDRQGNALIYGTTNGSLGRKKGAGDRFRDIFVVRLHRDDGSYKAVVEPHKVITEATLPPKPAPAPAPKPTPSNTATTANSASYKPPGTHKGATTDTSVNPVVILAGLGVPFILGIIIILATNKPKGIPTAMPSEPMGGTQMHVDFPSVRPPAVEQSLEMASTKPQQIGRAHV